MEVSAGVHEAFKRSKLMGATAYGALHCRPLFFGSTGSIARKDTFAHWQEASSSADSPQETAAAAHHTDVCVDLMAASTVASAAPSFNDSGIGEYDKFDCSNSSWVNGVGSATQQSDAGLDQGDSSSWLADETYDLSSWKSLPNIKLIDTDSLASLDVELAVNNPCGAAAAAYFDDIYNSLCRTEESAQANDAPPALYATSQLDYRFRTEWVMPDIPDNQIPQFRIQQPGNSSAVTVFSHLSAINVTYCNTLLRVAATVQ